MIEKLWFIFLIGVIFSQSYDTKPLHILYVNDIENILSEEVLNASLSYLRKNSEIFDFEIFVARVAANGAYDEELITSLCATYNAMVNNQTPPHLILDTTMTGATSESVKAFTAALGLPTVSTSFGQVGDIREWRQLNEEKRKYLIQVMPPADVIPGIIAAIVLRQNMSNAAILYDNTFVMNHKFKSLLKNTGVGHSIGLIDVNTIRQDLKKLHRLFFVNFFILGNIHTIEIVLEAAGNISYLNEQFSWYLLTQETGAISTDCTNCSIFVAQPIISGECREKLIDRIGLSTQPEINTSFYFDLIMRAFFSIVKVLNSSLGNFITCEEYYDSGTTPMRKNVELFNEMKKENTISPSCGHIHMISNGESHMDFEMDLKILKVVNGSIQNTTLVGTWSSRIHRNLTITQNKLMKSYTSIEILRVRVEEQDPFIFRDRSHPSGFNGYCIELLDELAKRMNFIYKMSIASGNMAGHPDKNGTWNGLIGDLINDKADLAMALYVSARRERVIDFTVPIYDLVGISILMKTEPIPVNIFKFFSALENELWLCILAVYFVTSILMWIFARFNPTGHKKNSNPSKCSRNNKQKKELVRKFTLTECLWFCMCAVTPQGGGEAPSNLSSRLIAASWYIFGFIITSSYTANLAAFLTVSRVENSIESLDDLADQFQIQYAPLKGSLEMEYYQNMARIEERLFETWLEMSINDSLSHIEQAKLAVWDYPLSHKYSKIWQVIQESGLPNSLEEAIKRVQKSRSLTEGFAFIGDATDVKYAELVNCDLRVVGPEFSVKSLAFAVQENSPLRKLLNENILDLLKHRVLQKLKEKWWNNHPKKMECPPQENNSDGMSVQTMGGVFLLLFAGIAVACTILAVDYWCLRYFSKSSIIVQQKKRVKKLQNKVSTVRIKNEDLLRHK